MGATAGWENFFVAEAGASAALAGLLVVAISINLTRILSFPNLPGRAAETLVLLLGVFAMSTFGLVPGQSTLAFGVEVLGIGVVTWLIPVLVQLRVPKHSEAKRIWMLTRVLTTQVSTIPYLVAGGGLLVGMDRAIYWIVPATLLSVIAGGLTSWVLLVEIQR